MSPCAVLLATCSLHSHRDGRRRIMLDGKRRRLSVFEIGGGLPPRVLDTLRQRAAGHGIIDHDAQPDAAALLCDERAKLVGICVVDVELGFDTGLGRLDSTQEMWDYLVGDAGQRVIAGIAVAATLDMELDAVPADDAASMALPFSCHGYVIAARSCTAARGACGLEKHGLGSEC